MKTKIAAALSVVAVLGAGSAAALVNTQILDSPDESTASAAILPPVSTIEVTVPATTATTSPVESITVTVPSATSPATTQPTTVPDPLSGHLTAFNVGEAGVVTVDVVEGRLFLVSAEPTPGWTVTATEGSDDNSVEAKFRSATVEVEFEAMLIDGEIVPRVESKSLAAAGGTAGSVTSNTTANTVDDDDHEDGDVDHDEADEDDLEDGHEDEDDDDHGDDDHEDEDDDDHGDDDHDAGDDDERDDD